MRYLFLSIIIAAFTITSCGDKEKKEATEVEQPKQEVVQPEPVVEEPEPEPIPEPEPQVRTVVVKQGEWLCDIARNEYGTLSGWTKIYEANKDKIDNPDIIQPDMELVIPE